MTCMCGCGAPTRIADKTRPSKGWVKGQPFRYISGHTSRTGTGSNYRRARRTRRRVLEHVLIMERAIGRALRHDEQVHHVNERRHDNDHRNLVACQDTAYHQLLHVRTRVVRAGGDPNNERVCGRCRQAKALSEFHMNRADKATGRVTTCRSCRQKPRTP